MIEQCQTCKDFYSNHHTIADTAGQALIPGRGRGSIEEIRTKSVRRIGLCVDLRESSAKGVAKVIFSAKVLCGLLTGSWSDESCVFTGSARRVPAD